MIDAYVVTESEHDGNLLKKLLPESVTGNVYFVAGKGRYNAESLASTILATRRVPTVLVIDADTERESAAHETESYARHLLADAAAGVPFDVVVAVPELEVLFLRDKSLLEKVAGRGISSEEWRLSQSNPQALLDAVLSRRSKDMVDRLSGEDIAALRTHPLIAHLSQFLSSAPTSLIGNEAAV